MIEGGDGLEWLGLGLILLTLALITWAWDRRQGKQADLPSGDVIYSDTGLWIRQQKPLYASDLRLLGKPDYLVQDADGGIIPVEVKLSLAPEVPHDGHVLQLASYCLLVDEEYGARPTYGILQYRDKAFAVDYTFELEEDLLDLLADMREDMIESEFSRDHDDWGRCTYCGLRDHCDQRLA
jgi:CRISPR-associated exonuclease Cas4